MKVCNKSGSEEQKVKARMGHLNTERNGKITGQPVQLQNTFV